MQCIPVSIARTLETAFRQNSHDRKSCDAISLSDTYKGTTLTWELRTHPEGSRGPDFTLHVRGPRGEYDSVVFKGIDDMKLDMFRPPVPPKPPMPPRPNAPREDGKSKVDESMIQTPIGRLFIKCGDVTFIQMVVDA